jgi:uncharacterized membrane protein YhfC
MLRLIPSGANIMDILYITYPLAIILIFGMAYGLGSYLTDRFKLGWRLYVIGAAVFLLSQVFHIPFNILMTLLFQRGTLPPPPPEWQMAFNIIFLSMSAGVFEEGARYLMYRFWTKEARSWGQGLLVGAGHGAGGEAMIFIGLLLLVNFLAMLAFRHSDLTGIVSPEQLVLLQGQLDAYWSVAWYDSLLPAFERALTIVLHLSLSILVLQVFTRGRIYWLGLAVLWHTFANAVALYVASTWGFYHSEAALTGVALLSLGIVFALRTPEPVVEDEQELVVPPPQKFTPLEIEEDPEKLTDSRYT